MRRRRCTRWRAWPASWWNQPLPESSGDPMALPILEAINYGWRGARLLEGFLTERLAKELWAAGLTEIGVSLDYAVPELHDAHRGAAGTFDKALRAVDVLASSAPRGGRQVVMISVIMHDNVDQLGSLLELSKA